MGFFLGGLGAVPSPSELFAHAVDLAAEQGWDLTALESKGVLVNPDGKRFSLVDVGWPTTNPWLPECTTDDPHAMVRFVLRLQGEGGLVWTGPRLSNRGSKGLTDADYEAAGARDPSVSNSEVARRLGIKPNSVLSWRKRRKVVSDTPSMQKGLTDADYEAAGARDPSVSHHEVARRLEISDITVLHWRKSRGIVSAFSSKKKGLTDADYEAAGARDPSVPHSEVARRMGIAPSGVAGWRKRRGIVPAFPPPQKGLTNADYEAAGARDPSVSHREVARRLGLHPSAVWRWRARRGIVLDGLGHLWSF